MIKWNGILSDAFGLIVEYIPEIILPERQINVYSVPGRSGDIIEIPGGYSNYTQSYSVFLEGDYEGDLPVRTRKIAEWLLTPNGYAKLEDSYSPNTYRYAYFKGPMNISNYLQQHGMATLDFVCNPKRYFTVGNEPLTFTGSTNTFESNLTAFPADPLIEVTGSGSGTVTINGVTIALQNFPHGSLFIDCETGNCYDSTGNQNESILALSFPKIQMGRNTVNRTGSITQVKITPRWWTL